MSRLSPIPTLPRRVSAGLLLAAICLTGCGQKGPLHLPDEAPAATATATDNPAATDPN